MSEVEKKETAEQVVPKKRETVEVDKKVLSEMMARLEAIEGNEKKRQADETYDPYAERVYKDEIKLVAIEGKEDENGNKEDLIIVGVKSGGKSFKKDNDGGQLRFGLMTMILVRNSKGEEVEMPYDYNELAETGKIIECTLKEAKQTPVIKDNGWVTQRIYADSIKLPGSLIPQDVGEVRNLVKGFKTKYILTLPNGEDIEVYESAVNIKY